jgi:GntR family transcriptional regulator
LKPCHHSVKSIWGVLLDDIRKGRYRDRLPPETELAAELGISRTQLRDGLAILEQSGFITRRRGIGTVINHHVVKVVTRLDLEEEFTSMIRGAGFSSEMLLISVEVRTDDPHLASKLTVPLSTPILSMGRVVTADGRPVIHSMDHVSFSIIKNFTYKTEDLALPVFHFLEKFCSTSVAMDLTEVKPIIADEALSKILAIEPGAPMLYLDEIAYNIDNEIIMYCQEYYVNDVLCHTVMRKKI